MDELVEKIRRFNRFYLPYMQLLGNRYLGTEYSATEARILFEIYEEEGCSAARIVQRVNVDKSYVSRIIRQYEGNGWLRRRRDEEDGRAYQLFLTEKGKEFSEDLIRKSNESIENIIRSLTEDERSRLSSAIDTVTEILSERREEA